MRPLLIVLLPLIVACKPPASDIEVGDPILDGFLADREDWLTDLAVPIEDCVGKVDTTHPAFHGCIDWHSHVHATFSLLAISRMTGDSHYADVAEQTLVPADLDAELDDLLDGGITPGEIPYGYSWFLVLARERERMGSNDLQSLAEPIADALDDHVSELTPARIASTHRSDDYTNLSWALLNLWLWADWTGDTDRATYVEDFVRNDIVPLTDCGLDTSEGRTNDFFPPCLHRARLILTVLPQDESQAWVQTALPDDFEITPIEPDSAHTAGLNFSRTWGLHALWQATDDTGIRDMYIDNLETHVNMPEYWAEDYMAHSHWVAQFGVYGIALSYGEDP